ncbi:hypothetical protein PAXINDRAFT_21138 [Paxillus involutus ATCC 200175]|uniref:Uncharacterized protein n=1 Tax=Paxillus involutus ATCC 200175 TaxID=664439 RepID=A0A0C9SM63_PAXIN|nr:hypothetical protein PAXINDRAFT_21138 [Paxillus involutus ATCC 200175]
MNTVASLLSIFCETTGKSAFMLDFLRLYGDLELRKRESQSILKNPNPQTKPTRRGGASRVPRFSRGEKQLLHHHWDI